MRSEAKQSLRRQADDWLSWPHEICHIAAAYLVGVPRWAMTYTARRIYIPYRLPRWKFVVVGLAPLLVWLSIVLVAGWGWQQLSDQPAGVAAGIQFVSDLVLIGARVVFPDITQRWDGSLATSVLACITVIAILYIPNALHDALISLPCTLRHWAEMRELREGESGERPALPPGDEPGLDQA